MYTFSVVPSIINDSLKNHCYIKKYGCEVYFQSVAEIGRNWKKWAEMGRNGQTLVEISRNWQKLAEIGRHFFPFLKTKKSFILLP
jgi:hypothetical protein